MTFHRSRVRRACVRQLLLGTVCVSGLLYSPLSLAQGLPTTNPGDRVPANTQGADASSTTPGSSRAAATSDTFQVQDIVVTAQRRSEKLQDVPIAVTALNQSALQSAGIQGVSELSKAVPGLVFNEQLGGQGEPRIRGVGVSANGPGLENPVAIYIDGVYYSSAAGALFALNDVAQVAVLKGPQGTLFGRNATGGLIQVTTKDPSHDLTLDLDGTVGTKKSYGGNLYVAGGLSDVLSAGLALNLDNQDDGFGVATWMDSTAYNHCFLVLPIALFLAWDRRDELVGVPIAADLRFAALAVPVVAVWLLAERLGIMEGRQLMVICLVQVLFLATLGWPMWKSQSGPLLYLFFLVPFGAFLTPVLQDFTAGFTTAGLDILGVPYYSDGYIIEIAQGVFYVAEACAGLRFLIASVAFGVLYALMMYRTPVRRGVFIAVSIVTPIIANGFRALGIVLLGRYLGSAEAAGADHIIYGWVFFSFVILMLVALGLPFRQDARRPGERSAIPPAPPIHARAALAACAVLVVVAAIGPAAASAMNRASRDAITGIPG